MFEIPGSQDVEIENGSIRQAWEKSWLNGISAKNKP
jgi:hypothetical protein